MVIGYSIRLNKEVNFHVGLNNYLKKIFCKTRLVNGHVNLEFSPNKLNQLKHALKK